MTDLEQKVNDVLQNVDEEYELIELSVNRETVDAYVVTEVDAPTIRKEFESELSDGLMIGLDVQKESMEDYDQLVKHVNFKYRD